MNELIVGGETQVEVIDGPTMLGSIVKSETDIQIATAKRFPRSISEFRNTAREMVTLNPAVASRCFYAVPRDGKTIEGPSIRLAEIAASCWGNMRIAARIVADDGKMVTAQGMCWDLQRNVAISREVQRRVTRKDGSRFSDDMVIVTCNAACSIALRNAIFAVVPRAYINELWAAAVQVARGDAKTLELKRQEWLAYWTKKGVKQGELMAVLGVKGPADIGLDQIATMAGLATSIEEGMTVEELFRPSPDPAVMSRAIEAINSVAKAGSEPKPESRLETEPEQKGQADQAKGGDMALIAEINDLLVEYLGGDRAGIAAAVKSVFGCQLAQLARKPAAELSAKLPVLRAYLDALPDADETKGG